MLFFDELCHKKILYKDEEQHKREKLFLKSNCVIPLLTFSIAIIPT